MAAAEALWDGQAPAPFSIFAVGDVDEGPQHGRASRSPACCPSSPRQLHLAVPRHQRRQQGRAGEVRRRGDYRPNIPVAYWGFRWMIGFGMASFAIGAAGLWLTRQEVHAAAEHLRTGEDEVPQLVLSRNQRARPRARHAGTGASRSGPGLPADRQLLGLDLHRDGPPALGRLRRAAAPADAVSPGVSQGEVLTSLIVFTAAVRGARRRSRSG